MATDDAADAELAGASRLEARNADSNIGSAEQLLPTPQRADATKGRS